MTTTLTLSFALRATAAPISRRFHRMIAQYGGNIGIVQRAAKPVGAQQQYVARHELVPPFFESKPVVCPQQIGDDIGEWMVRRGFGSDFTAVDEVLDIAV